MPTIRIDDDVWSYLKSKARPFEDAPNDVLRRELRIMSDGQQSTLAGVLGRGRQAQMVQKIIAGRPDARFELGQRDSKVTLNAPNFPEITVGRQGGVQIDVRTYDESKKSALQWALEADQLLAKQNEIDAKRASTAKRN
ncbi:MAG: hypothetical protein WA609_11160 [Terriglobales bacterium]